jgi:alkylation response protein AidB-like acyl-CoA dehydrogenase
MWDTTFRYQPPTQDLGWLLGTHFKGVAEIIDPQDAHDLFEMIGRFASEVIAPTNKPGDQKGAQFTPASNGKAGYVSVPNEFHKAYDQFTEMGLVGLSASEEYGGQGLPAVIKVGADEMMLASNMSFSPFGGLTAMAISAINAHATDELKEIYLPKMISGEWTGTMNLTEPHAGSDLGALKSRATPQEDGSYVLDGNKIFITGGEHDLTENIVHLVLAKTPDAPTGTKGLSLFIVPKFLPQEQDDGSIANGKRNAVECIGIEHKEGLHASPTCAMAYNGATGYLIGEVNKGLECMFTMMNAARLAVGGQGLALADSTLQTTSQYAAERHVKEEPINEFSNVEIKLQRLKAFTEGARALSMWTAMAMDLAVRLPEGSKEQQEMISRAAVMTPLIKGHFTDTAAELINDANIVWGGAGYLEDYPMAQINREVPISRIYEGTSDIIALHVLGNAHHAREGFFPEAMRFVAENQSNPNLKAVVEPFGKALQTLIETSMSILPVGMKAKETRNFDHINLIATPYMEMFGKVAVGLMWAQMAKTVDERYADADEAERAFLDDKFQTAQFYMQDMLRVEELAKDIQRNIKDNVLRQPTYGETIEAAESIAAQPAAE